jgi:exopolysaccharide production protein ExoQ
VVLLATSAAESTVLVEFGWLLLLVCAVKAAQGMSWRSALRRHEPPPVEPGIAR